MGWNEQEAGVKAAFAALRKRGVMARRRAACCGGCSGALMGDLLEKHSEKLGAVFTHRQSEARFHRPYGANSLMISYGARKGGDTKAIGMLLFEALKAQGVVCEWDGNPDTNIEVKGC